MIPPGPLSLLLLLVAMLLMQLALMAFAFALVHVGLVFATYCYRFRLAFGGDGSPDWSSSTTVGVEPEDTSESHAGGRPNLGLYFVRALRETGGVGTADPGDVKGEHAPAACPTCGAENDPSFTYCRNCATKLRA